MVSCVNLLQFLPPTNSWFQVAKLPLKVGELTLSNDGCFTSCHQQHEVYVENEFIATFSILVKSSNFITGVCSPETSPLLWPLFLTPYYRADFFFAPPVHESKKSEIYYLPQLFVFPVFQLYLRHQHIFQLVI